MQKAFQEASNYGEKSDILRYEILERHGGVYVDVDMQCLQAFDRMVEVRSPWVVVTTTNQDTKSQFLIALQSYSFVVGISNTGCVEINNAVIAAVPGHPILQRLIETIHHRSRQSRLDNSMLDRIAQFGGSTLMQHLDLKQSAGNPIGTIENTGPGLMTRTFMDAVGWTTKSGTDTHGFLSHAEQDTVIALPVECLFPLPNSFTRNSRHATDHFPTDALAVHYWERSWMATGGFVSAQDA
jgi:hypothetical protein